MAQGCGGPLSRRSGLHRLVRLHRYPTILLGRQGTRLRIGSSVRFRHNSENLSQFECYFDRYRLDLLGLYDRRYLGRSRNNHR